MGFEYQNFASLGVNLNRQKYGPLDISTVFNSFADFNYYIHKGNEDFKDGVSEYWLNVTPYPYEGQILTVTTENASTTYVLTQWDDSENKFNYEILTTKDYVKDAVTVSVDEANCTLKFSSLGSK